MSAPKWFGYSGPFVSGSRILPFQADERLIKNDLLQLLMTLPTERVMRPSYGTKLRGYTFDMLSTADAAILRSDIIEAIRRYEPRVNISDVEFRIDENNNLLNISIIASTDLRPNSDFLVELNIPTNEARIR